MNKKVQKMHFSQLMPGDLIMAGNLIGNPSGGWRVWFCSAPEDQHIKVVTHTLWRSVVLIVAVKNTPRESFAQLITDDGIHWACCHGSVNVWRSAL